MFLEAEQARAAGVLDEDAFATALRLDPGHEGAAAVLAGIAPARTTVGSAMTPRQTPAAVTAIVLLGLLGLGLLWRGSSERPEPLEDFAHDSTLDARTLDEADATLADATLPG